MMVMHPSPKQNEGDPMDTDEQQTAHQTDPASLPTEINTQEAAASDLNASTNLDATTHSDPAL